MSSSKPTDPTSSGGSAPSSSQAQTSTSIDGAAATSAAATTTEPLVPVTPKKDVGPKQASSKTASSGAYRDEYEEEDADQDDEDLDPRYAIDSYQSSSKSSAPPKGISSSNAQASNKHVVFDAASLAAENRAGSPSQGGQQARGSHLPAWGSAALARGQNQSQEQQQQGIPTSSSRSTLPDHYSYATSHGVQLSSLCFAAWAFPPFSSVLVLVWETENDLARFHAYQAGICGVALVVLLYFLRSWLHLDTLSIIVGMGALGWFWVCGSAASNNAPTLERVPYIAYAGPLAEQWLGDE